MRNENVVTAIDVGTTKVCTLVAKASSKGASIIGVGVEPCRGLKKGTVVDVEETRRAVRASIHKAERQAGMRVRSAFVGVTGSHIESSNSWVPVVSSMDNRVITSDELKRLSRSLVVPNAKAERLVIHTLPLSYALDGKAGIRNPVGMHVSRMEMHTQMVTGSSALIGTLVEAVTGVGIEMRGLVLQPLASGEAVLTEDERDMGVVMVDIGGGTSDIAVFRGGAMVYTSVIPVGGFQFTNDISVMFDTAYEHAEEIKLKYGNVNPDMVEVDETVGIKVIGQAREARMPRREICQAVKERAVELLQFIRAKLEEASLEGVPDARIVLTGGAANLPGLDQLARRVLSASVRIGVPVRPDGISEELRNPSYSTSVGILLWSLEDALQWSTSSNGHKTSEGLYNRLLGWFLGRVKSVVPA